MDTAGIGSIPFPEAARVWLESRKDFLGKSTYRDYVIYIRTLGKFFGTTARLDTFTADDIRRYQHSRLEKAIGSPINKETSILQQLLKRTGRCSEIGHDYQPLPTSKESRGRALTDAERARLFGAAASSPSRQATYLFAVISLNTTAGPSELLTLRLKDIDVAHRTIRIQPEGAKNAHRVRVRLAHREVSPADGIFHYCPVKVECTHARMACKDCGADVAKDCAGKSPKEANMTI